MALTREERGSITEMVKRIRKLERERDDLQLRVNALEQIVNKLDSETDMSGWSKAQWEAFLRPFISSLSRSSKPSKHNHETDEQGGPAFAKLGATLVE